MRCVSASHGHRPQTKAGVDFIKAAWCPLRFSALPLQQHPEFARLGQVDPALASLQVGEPLRYARHYPYWDRRAHREKRGTQVITAAFGLAPEDFDLFLAIYHHLKEEEDEEALPEDHVHHWTADFLGNLAGLPVTNTKDYLRIRSRLFRLSFTQVLNSAFWNPRAETYDIRKFSLFNIEAMSRLTESRRPIEVRIDGSFAEILSLCRSFGIDFDLYRGLPRAERRFYLIANREGWNRPESPVFLADEFARHQLGYSDAPEQDYANRQRLKGVIAAMEDRDFIRPPGRSKSYFRKHTAGVHAGRITLQWSRGPQLLSKRSSQSAARGEDLSRDPLYCQVRAFCDEQGKPVTAALYRHWLAKFGRARMQKHAPVIAAQIEHRPETITRSQIAAFADRLSKDYREPPDWYREVMSEDRLPTFDGVQPNQLSMELYGVCFSGK